MKSLLYSALMISMLCFSGCAACGGGACGGGLQAVAGGGCLLGGRLAARKAARATFSDQGVCDACGTDEFVSAQPCDGGCGGGCASAPAPASVPCDACGTDEFVSAQPCGGGGQDCGCSGGSSFGGSTGGGVGFSFGDNSGMGLGLNEKGSACAAEGTSRIGSGQFRSMVAGALPGGGAIGGGLIGGGCGLGHGGGCRLGSHSGCLLSRGLGHGGRGAGGLMGGRGGGRGPYGGQIPHTAQQQGAGTGMAPSYAYPYYTTRGPRDFLQDNPPTIGY